MTKKGKDFKRAPKQRFRLPNLSAIFPDTQSILAHSKELGLAIWTTFLEDRDRWPLWMPVILGAGIALHFALPAEPGRTISFIPIFLSGSLFGIMYLNRAHWAGRDHNWFYGAYLFVICAMIAALGFGAAKLRTEIKAAPVLEKEMGPVMLEGMILTASRQPGEKWRIEIAPNNIERLAAEQLPEKVRLSVRQKDVAPIPGQQIKILSVLMPPPGPVSPNAFDFARQAYFNQLGAVGYSVGRPIVLADADESLTAGVAQSITAFRLAVAERIRAALPGTKGQIAAALMTGDREAIEDDAVEALRTAGLAHLLAISGLHMALVGGLVFSLIRLGLASVESLVLKYPIKKWAAIGGMIGAFSYLIISGAGISTQRAFIMISLMFIAILLDRSALSMRVVAIAAFVILLISPESLLNVSFQMSFAAVIGLISFYEAKRDRFLRAPELRKTTSNSWYINGRKILLYFGGIALTTIIAEVTIGPFAAFHFNRVAGYGLIANLLAMPIVGVLVMPCAVLAFLLMPLGLEQIALTPMGWGIEAIVWVATEVSSLDGSEFLVPSWPISALGLMCLGGLWLALWRRTWRYAGLVMILLGLLQGFSYLPPDLIIDREGKNIAVRNGEGALTLLTTNRAKFAADNWLRRDGEPELALTRLTYQERSKELFSCDALGCVTTDVNLPRISHVTDPRILEEECQRADIVVASIGVSRALERQCRKVTLLIDRFDVWRNGAYAVWFEEDGFRLEHAAGQRGNRPWSPSR